MNDKEAAGPTSPAFLFLGSAERNSPKANQPPGTPLIRSYEARRLGHV